jgi:glycosyltransferase involved in cell wall biosynthesis
LPMRIAWLGPTPTEDAGVSYMAGQLLRAFASKGIHVDAFLDARPGEVPAELTELPGVSYRYLPTGWQYQKWYSNTAFTKFATGLAARGVGQLRLAREVARSHAQNPYSVLYQFSHFEASAVRPFARRLPPLVVHPETHIGGELEWHRREAALSAQCEPWVKRAGVRSVLVARAAAQRRDSNLPRRFVVPSTVFRNAIASDYEVPLERFSVIPNPIDLDRYQPASPTPRDTPLRVLFVSRIAVRKGVELAVALTHRLQDLQGRVRVEIIGDRALWSDYRPLLDDLAPTIGTYVGSVPGRELAASIRAADVLIQPSHYEPFGLTVGEALASGVPVVVSDAVGAAEFVDGPAVARFPTGDIAALEHAVRGMLDSVESTEGRELLRTAARAQAERAFSLDTIASSLESVLEDL